MSAETDTGYGDSEFSAAEARTGPIPRVGSDRPDLDYDDLGPPTVPIPRIDVADGAPPLPTGWASTPESPGEITLPLDAAAIANYQPLPVPVTRRRSILRWRGRSAAAPAPVSTPVAPPVASVASPPFPGRPAPASASPPRGAGSVPTIPMPVVTETGPRPKIYPLPQSDVRRVEQAPPPVSPVGDLQIHLVDEEALLKARAHEIGERRLSEALAAHQGAGSVLRNIWHRDFKEAGRVAREAARHPVEGFKQHRDEIWKGNIARDYFLLKETRKARDEILEVGNIFVHDNADRSVHEREVGADVNRFVHEYHQSLDAGEQRTQLVSPEAQPVVQAIHELIRDAVNNNWDEAAFREARTRRIEELGAANPDLMKEASLYGDNLGQIVEQVRARIAAGQNLENILSQTQIYLDQSKMGVRTEVRYSKAEKVVEAIHSTKVGSMVNEATIAVAVSAAYTVARVSSRSALRALAHPLGPLGLGIPSAAFAGLRESGRMKDERAQHMRERAQGVTRNFNPETRRAGFEETTYETVNATGARELIESALYTRNPDGTMELKPPTVDNLALGLGYLADMEVRRRMSAEQGIDLIGFSSAETVASERRELYLTMAQAKVDLRTMARNNPGMLAQLTDAPNFDMALARRENILMNSQEHEVSAKDKVFKRFKRREVGKAMGKAALLGIGLGLVAQEATAFVRADEAGLVKDLADHYSPATGDVHQTVLRALIDPVGGKEHLIGGGIHHTEIINGHTVNVPVGTELVHGPNGSFDLMSGHTIEASGLHFQPDGQLTAASLDHLSGLGVAADVHKNIVSTVTHHERTVGAKDFVKTHAQSLTTVHRELWYDNNTPNVFDHNELKLWWGANNGLDQNGNYVFNVSHMAPGGSFHDGLSANAQHLIREGRLKVMLSMSEGTQDHVFAESVNSQGNIVINAHSEAAQLFRTQDVGGVKSAVFVGRFAEVDQVMSQHAGVDNVRMLATAVGSGVNTMKESTPTVVEHTTYTTTFDVLAPRVEVPVDVPPFIPIYGRRGLEPVEQPGELPEALVADLPIGNPAESKIFSYYYQEMTAEQRARFAARRSDTLNNDPSAVLDPYTEVESYFARQSPAYRLELEALVNQVPPMSADIRAAVIMPVAGHQEGANIYRTLENYTNQSAAPNEYEIALFVNHPDMDEDGNPIAPDSTLDEISRFRADHPEINIRLMYQVIPRDEFTIGKIRKLAADAEVMRHHARGPSAGDLIIISNDADSVGIDPLYIENYMEKFERDATVDALLGQVDWDPEAFLKYPAIHVGTRLFQYVDSILRHDPGFFSGINFAVKASSYSAVGGYGEDIHVAEDVDLGHALRVAREGARDGIIGVGYAGTQSSRVYSSARRAIHAYEEHGLGPYQQWNPGFGAFDDEIRRMDVGAKVGTVDFNDPAQVDAFLVELERIVNQTIPSLRYQMADGTVYSAGANRSAVDRALGMLGIKFDERPDGSIGITDASELITGLKNYENAGYAAYRRRVKGERTTPVRPPRGSGSTTSPPVPSTMAPTPPPSPAPPASAPSPGSPEPDASSRAAARPVYSDDEESPEYGATDRDVIERALAQERADTARRTRAKASVGSKTAASPEAKPSSAESVSFRDLADRIGRATRRSELEQIARDGVASGLFVEAPAAPGGEDPAELLAQRYRPVSPATAAAIYRQLIAADERVTSYTKLRAWLQERRAREEGPIGDERREEIVRLKSETGNVSVNPDLDFSETSIDAILSASSRPNEEVVDALQVQLIAAGHIAYRYVTPSELEYTDLNYMGGRPVRLRALDAVGLHALRAIDDMFVRSRRRRLARA
jgi:hypothetical protein